MTGQRPSGFRMSRSFRLPLIHETVNRTLGTKEPPMADVSAKEVIFEVQSDDSDVLEGLRAHMSENWHPRESMSSMLSLSMYDSVEKNQIESVDRFHVHPKYHVDHKNPTRSNDEQATSNLEKTKRIEELQRQLDIWKKCYEKEVSISDNSTKKYEKKVEALLNENKNLKTQLKGKKKTIKAIKKYTATRAKDYEKEILKLKIANKKHIADNEHLKKELERYNDIMNINEDRKHALKEREILKARVHKLKRILDKKTSAIKKFRIHLKKIKPHMKIHDVFYKVKDQLNKLNKIKEELKVCRQERDRALEDIDELFLKTEALRAKLDLESSRSPIDLSSHFGINILNI